MGDCPCNSFSGKYSFGEYIYDNGDYYIGELLDEIPHGKGELY